MNENLFTNYIFMNMCLLFMVQHPNIKQQNSQKVRKTVRLQAGVYPPFIDTAE